MPARSRIKLFQEEKKTPNPNSDVWESQRHQIKDYDVGRCQHYFQITTRLYRLSYRSVVIILVVLLCIGLGMAFAGTYSLSVHLFESQALHYSEVAASTLDEARKLYSENVVRRLDSIEEVAVSAEYHSIQGGIPNPATYTIELGERLSDPSQGILFRLYSDYPFPNRKETGGPKDQFEQDALTYLKANPDSAFYRKEKSGAQTLFRYTQAVRMEPSCVVCHNKLPSSPKKDWKVGQVRGVVEITQPLDNLILIARDGLKAIYAALATIIALAISGLILVIGRFRLVNQELEQKVAQRTAALDRLSKLDGLTQLANRRQFDEFLEQTWQQTRRQQEPLSLILCDLDHFKQYNDTYGHQAGDQCLRSVGQVLKNSVKHSGELAARYGGEEFAIVLPYATSFEATQLASLVQSGTHQLKIPHQASSTQPYVTLSMGIATLVPDADKSPQYLIECADEALYQAKNKGRDCFFIRNLV